MDNLFLILVFLSSMILVMGIGAFIGETLGRLRYRRRMRKFMRDVR